MQFIKKMEILTITKNETDTKNETSIKALTLKCDIFVPTITRILNRTET